jgi:alpha-glucosidase
MLRELVGLVGLLSLPLFAQEIVKSPNGDVELSISAASGQLSYSVNFRGKPVILKSALGLNIRDEAPLGTNVRITGSKPGSVDESYTMPHGKSNPVRNVCRTLSVDVEETSGAGRKMTIEARAYDDGAAFRYVIPSQFPVTAFTIVNEATEFQLAKDGSAFPLILDGFHTSYEDNYHPQPLTGIHPSSLVALPFLVELPGIAWVAITEGNLDNYAGLYLTRSGREAKSMFAKLAPAFDEPGVAVRATAPTNSPWRVIMIGQEPGRLVESNIVINLNPPSRLADTSWIKPGKTAWDWWNGPYAEGVSFKPGMNTETEKHFVDFSAASGFDYILIDEGWAAGSGRLGTGSDLSHFNPNMDLPAVLAYAREKGVRVWLWAHWNDINRQMDQVFPLFEKWGIAGVKIDFMDRDDQWMVNYYHRVLEKAAQHHLMIDFHGAYKPDGMRRTWPHLMTSEGVMGAEYNKWSARVTPDHNVMLAFTRMLAGPLDYTPGGFNQVRRDEFVPKNSPPTVMGTRAHAIALYAVFESPFQMVSDYPEAYRGQKEFEYMKAAPVVWDETRVLSGRPDEYISVARRRGREWFVGSLTTWQPREIDLPLEFLGRGEFVAEIWSDAADAGENPKHTVHEEKRVNASGVLHVKMAPGGGNAIRIRPAEGSK